MDRTSCGAAQDQPCIPVAPHCHCLPRPVRSRTLDLWRGNSGKAVCSSIEDRRPGHVPAQQVLSLWCTHSGDTSNPNVWERRTFPGSAIALHARLHPKRQSKALQRHTSAFSSLLAHRHSSSVPPCMMQERCGALHKCKAHATHRIKARLAVQRTAAQLDAQCRIALQSHSLLGSAPLQQSTRSWRGHCTTHLAKRAQCSAPLHSAQGWQHTWCSVHIMSRIHCLRCLPPSQNAAWAVHTAGMNSRSRKMPRKPTCSSSIAASTKKGSRMRAHRRYRKLQRERTTGVGVKEAGG